MGNSISGLRRKYILENNENFIKMNDDDMYKFNFYEESDSDDYMEFSKSNDVRVPFSGIWSIIRISGKVPEHRVGHFTVYSKELHLCFIGYGKIKKNICTNDVWCLNVDTLKWEKLKLYGAEITPRKFSIATLMDKYLVVYGGKDENDNYHSDLHTIDITTGEVIMINTYGTKPPPCQSGCIAIYDRKLYIYAGDSGKEYNGSYLYSMDFDTLKWTAIPSNIVYNLGCSSVILGSRIILYGGSQSTNLTIINIKRGGFKTIPTYSNCPYNIFNAGFIKAGGYLFYIGGLTQDYWTLIYGCSIKTKKWFIFYVVPDGESTSISDGLVSEDGIFYLPQIHSFSCIYLEHKREIYGFLGIPLQSRRISVISMNDAFCSLNLTDDLISMLALQ